ncbi:LOW QUALITY PROTEIN: magnesium chelatase, partial [Kutzneria sp. 744]
MPLSRTWSVALLGVDGVPVEIEADVSHGKPKVQLLGLPDTALNESKDRVRAAVRNSGLEWPDQVMLALSPADLPKGGSGYDLGLACAVLAGAGSVPQTKLVGTVMIGELALDGRVRPVRGVLPRLLAARRAGLKCAVVPEESLAEAALVAGIQALGAHRLADVLSWLKDEESGLVTPRPPVPAVMAPGLDLADVVGQPEARWALEVSAAGAHNPARRTAGHRQNHAGRTHHRAVAAAHAERGAGGDGHPLHRRHAVSQSAAHDGADAHRPTPLGVHGVPHRRRRRHGPTRRDQPGPSRRALLGRSLRIRRIPVGGAADRRRGGRDPDRPPRRRRALPRPIPVGAGHEPVPLRADPRRRLQMLAVRAAAVLLAPVRAAAGPHRHPHPDAAHPRHGQRRPRAAGEFCDGAGAGHQGSGASGRAVGRARLADQRRGARTGSAPPFSTAGQGHAAARSRTRDGLRQRPWRGPVPPHRLDACRPGREGPPGRRRRRGRTGVPGPEGGV